MEKKFTVYLNPNYNGIAIFSNDDGEDDCLYFTAWFHGPDFEMLMDLSDAEDKKTAEKKIEDFCSNYDKWDGNCHDPEEGGIRNFDQFWEIRQQEDSWYCIY